MAEEKEGILKWLSKPFVWVAQNIVSFGSWVTSPIRNAIWGKESLPTNQSGVGDVPSPEGDASYVSPADRGGVPPTAAVTPSPQGKPRGTGAPNPVMTGAQNRGERVKASRKKTEQMSDLAGGFLRTIQNAFPIQTPEEDSVRAAGRVNPRRTSAKAAGDQAGMVTALGGHVEQLKGTEVKAGELHQGAGEFRGSAKKKKEESAAQNTWVSAATGGLITSLWSNDTPPVPNGNSGDNKVEAPRKTPAVEGNNKQVQPVRGSSSGRWW